MPVESAHLPITVPAVDLWGFLFERTDRVFPDDHVIYVDVANQKRHTFRDVQNSAQKFGQNLRSGWRWKKGDVMAFFTPNTTDIAAAMFGVHFAGGVVCPFNNLYTVGELASQLKSSQANGLVTNVACLDVAHKAALIAGLALDRIILVGERDRQRKFRHFTNLEAGSSEAKRVHMDASEDLAFLVYSSGTTGLPKGVMLTHSNIIANILQADVVDGDNISWRTDKSIGFLPMYHIYGIAVLLLGPVYRGVTVHIMPRFDLGQFCKVVESDAITTAWVVPPVVLLLAKHPLVAQYNLDTLRMMHSSAAPLTNDLVDMVYKRLKVPIKQGYGLSEAGPGVSAQNWSSWNKTMGSAGSLYPSMSLKCIKNEEELPRGKTGEIWLKGPNIFKGYYNNPKATAESITLEGWYRTGDVGHVDDDGNIYITDRVKELIKYNGFQVAPAQLEGLLQGHPAVNDVAVIGVYSHEKATELPRAYVVLAAGHTASAELGKVLCEWLNDKVAPYKRLRGGIRFVDAVPKSAAGKLLRRVLMEQARKEQSSKL